MNFLLTTHEGEQYFVNADDKIEAALQVIGVMCDKNIISIDDIIEDLDISLEELFPYE